MRYDLLIVEPFRDMMVRVAHFIPTLLIALGILFIGFLIAHAVEKLLVRFFKTIEFDKLTDKVGINHALSKGGMRKTPSELIGCLTYWVFTVMVLIMTVKSLGLTSASDLLDKVLVYIPNVITGVVVLIIGMLLARFVSAIVYITAKNADLPGSATLSRVSKWAIVAYVAIIYLKEIGFVSLFVGSHYTIFITGIVFSLALAFGLAGKDIASRYLEVLNIHRPDPHK